MATEKSDKFEMPLQYLLELPLFLYDLNEDDIKQIRDFVPKDEDVFIVTYPKCGTTWMQYMVWEIIHRGVPPPDINDVMFNEFPYLEMTGPKPLEVMKPPRIFKSHLPQKWFHYWKNAKYIYVLRNPWDTCISYFHHTYELEKVENMSFEDFIECFLNGKVPYGNYFEHVSSWIQYMDEPNVLWMHYEDMQKDPASSIVKIARFLGDEHLKIIEKDNALLEKIINFTSFDYMKSNVGFFGPTDGTEYMKRDDFIKTFSTSEASKKNKRLRRIDNFIRKGGVGGFKNRMSPEQIQLIREQMEEKLDDKELKKRWNELLN